MTNRNARERMGNVTLTDFNAKILHQTQSQIQEANAELKRLDTIQGWLDTEKAQVSSYLTHLHDTMAAFSRSGGFPVADESTRAGEPQPSPTESWNSDGQQAGDDGTGPYFYDGVEVDFVGVWGNPARVKRIGQIMSARGKAVNLTSVTIFLRENGFSHQKHQGLRSKVNLWFTEFMDSQECVRVSKGFYLFLTPYGQTPPDQ